jgi:hypothetical protein
MNEKYVSHDQLLFILLVILIGLAIFSFAMIKHAVELRDRTTKVIQDLAYFQGYVDVEDLTINLDYYPATRTRGRLALARGSFRSVHDFSSEGYCGEMNETKVGQTTKV